MAMKTSHLAGLLILGFVMLIIGWPWWLGIGLIILSMAIAVSGGGDEEPAPRTVQAAARAVPRAAVAGPAVAAAPKAKSETPGSIEDNFYFRPSIPPDGIASISSIKPDKEQLKAMGDPGNLSVGKRTGTLSLYMDDPYGTDEGMRIRVKDDIRLHMPFMSQKDENNIAPFQNLFTSHFRTGKNILKTKCLESTFETIKTGFDQWAKEDEEEAQEMYRKYGIPP